MECYRKNFRNNWNEKERNVDVFDVKKDVVQTLIEAGYKSEEFFIDNKTPNYYHPGKSGRLFLKKDEDRIQENVTGTDSPYLKFRLLR